MSDNRLLRCTTELAAAYLASSMGGWSPRRSIAGSSPVRGPCYLGFVMGLPATVIFPVTVATHATAP